MQTENAPKGAHVAIVRAIPNPPHKHRWCGLERWVPDPEKRPQQEMEELPQGGLRPLFDEQGRPIYAKHALPWPESEIKVYVVDHPAPFDPNANGGVPVEISPSTLKMLERDPRIAVRLVGEGGSGADVVDAKAKLAKAEDLLLEARRDLAAEQERASRFRAETLDHDKKQVERMAELEAHVRSLSAQVQQPKKKG